MLHHIAIVIVDLPVSTFLTVEENGDLGFSAFGFHDFRLDQAFEGQDRSLCRSPGPGSALCLDDILQCAIGGIQVIFGFEHCQ
ncbi:MAG: hypothetical protein KKA78_09450, partial [Alphaproteobacteria bacterium]|nr:hypothetical protein [Alphaproteobacteria bacterium]